MVRGSGKFKQKRGGGRNFSKNLVLDENGTAVSTDKPRVRRGMGDEEGSDEESEEEEEEEEESEEEEPAAGGSAEPQPELSRAERKELKKKQAAAKQGQGSDEDEDLINPNHVGKKMNISDLGAPRELSRREREQKEKQDAKDRYWKLHLAGKTDQAKSDLGRLAKIRAEREAAQAKRQAEAEAKTAELEAKAAAAKR
ncbi:casein kinase substrate phosphoprotein PP28-domain-containing protein [Mycena epipterygia]|nr:casein kinase substrate phosphoprotein PP28-domain-containing protein [Mycena epipterygia]